MFHILFLIFSKINTIVCFANNYSGWGENLQRFKHFLPLRLKGSKGSMGSKGCWRRFPNRCHLLHSGFQPKDLDFENNFLKS
jgi:hypothetical protein